MDRYAELEDRYKPILKSPEKLRNRIVEHLKPVERPKEEVRLILEVKRRRVEEEPVQHPRVKRLYESMMQRDPNLDTFFGILIDPENNMKIGSKDIEITDDDSILLDGRLHTITEGLWIFYLSDPNLYITADLIEYAALMNQTHALRTDFDHESMQLSAISSKKWKHILSHIWKGAKDGGVGTIQLIYTSGKEIFTDNRIEIETCF